MTANSTSFQSDTAVYQASYVSGLWSGELAAYSVSSAGVASTANWKASEHVPAYPGRTILTWNGTAGATFPTASQTSALARSTGLAQVTGADAYELERRLGHRSQRYIQRYTNPPEAVAASYVEEF